MNNTDRAPTIDDYLKAPAHPFRQAGDRRSAIKRERDPERPLVTIFTIVRNRQKTLPQTILSVLAQSYPDIEYIVIDGASTDGTLDVIKQFDDKIDLWISEPDAGTADASNKAISLARGDFVFWLSSDDWIDPDFIDVAVKTLLRSRADFVFGKMALYENGAPVVVLEGDKDYAKSLVSGNPKFNFPSMVIRRECFERVGLLDLSYRITNDYEWTLRLHLRGGIGVCNNELTVCKGIGGIADSHPFRSALEELRVLRQHRLPTAKAAVIHIYRFARRGLGHLVRFVVPNVIYKRLRRASKCRQSHPAVPRDMRC